MTACPLIAAAPMIAPPSPGDDAGSARFHTSFPLLASTAYATPAAEPMNTHPPSRTGVD